MQSSTEMNLTVSQQSNVHPLHSALRTRLWRALPCARCIRWCPRDQRCHTDESPNPGRSTAPSEVNWRAVFASCRPAPLPESICPAECELGNGTRIAAAGAAHPSPILLFWLTGLRMHSAAYSMALGGEGDRDRCRLYADRQALGNSVQGLPRPLSAVGP